MVTEGIALCVCLYRKRLSCSEYSFTESDFSPPGVRRRFSALMDTHRVSSPLEMDTVTHTRHAPVKTRGTSLEGATMAASSGVGEASAAAQATQGLGV